MRTFFEYMADLAFRFDDIYQQAEEAFKRGKYNIAWDLIKSAKPANEDQASLKTHFIEALREKSDEFLTGLKKRKLTEVGGTNWGDLPKQNPIDPEHPERSALFSTDLDGNDKPPARKKYGKDRFKMKKNR